MTPAGLRLGCFLACSVATTARAQTEARAPSDVTGVVEEAREPGDASRAIGSVLLYPARATVDLIFVATGSAAGFLESRQVVPRVRELVAPGPGEIGVYPTAFVETGQTPNIGARMIMREREAATTVRAGFGGTDEVALETRVRLSRTAPVPFALDLEVLYDRSTDVEYLGVGQDPETDPRNRFVGRPRTALYRERKVRGLLGLGLRPAEDLELLVSGSFTRRSIDDPPDAGVDALSRTFVPRTVPGASGETNLFYGELALRIDTRETRGLTSPGALAESYAGSALGLDDSTHLVRLGGRLGAFVPVLRRSNVAGARLVLDHLVRFPGAPVPFTELTTQPDFRGFDDRRDDLSLVASIDYRFAIIRYVAGRLFTDAATVAESPSKLDPTDVRVAFGLGVDVASSDAPIGELLLSLSPDGVRLLLSFGVSSAFGDRQHRD